jgi:hypothetical protein
VIAVPQRIRHSEQDERHEQVPLELLRPHRSRAEQIAQEHVRRHEHDDDEREPGGPLADDIDQALDTPPQRARLRVTLAGGHQNMILSW